METFTLPLRANQSLQTGFYIWRLLAQELALRLQMLKQIGQRIAIIGPSHHVLEEALYARQHELHLEHYEAQWHTQPSQFDMIILHGVAGWFDHPPALLQSVYQSLQPNGICLLSTLGPDSLKDIQQQAKKMGWSPRADALIDMHHWGDVLFKTGFVDPVTDRVDIDIAYKQIQDWFMDWRQVGLVDPSMPATTGLITPARWQALLDSIQADPGQPWLAHLECIFAYAIKPQSEQQKLDAQGNVSVDLNILKQTLPSNK